MTTTVKITAYHGVPVEVDAVDPKSGEVLWTMRIDPGTEYVGCAHSGQNILIRELGPQDIAETSSPAQPE